MHDSSRYGTQDMQAAILHHLNYTAGKDADHATTYDWRMALSHALGTGSSMCGSPPRGRAYAAGAKRVYYLSMEFLIGRLLDDGLINLRLQMRRARR
jgi:starch phosphorylase